MSHAFFSSISSLLPFWLFSQLLIFVSIGHDATEKQRKTFWVSKVLAFTLQKPRAGQGRMTVLQKVMQSQNTYVWPLRSSSDSCCTGGGWVAGCSSTSAKGIKLTNSDGPDRRVTVQQDWVPSMKEVRGNKGFLIRSLHEKRMKEIMRFPTLSHGLYIHLELRHNSGQTICMTNFSPQTKSLQWKLSLVVRESNCTLE